MQQTLRPYVTAGVASAAAGMIAVTPVAAPLPDIQVPAVQLSAASTDLFGTLGNTVDALVNPIGGLSGGGSVPGLGELPALSGSLASLDPAGVPNFLTPYADLVTNTLGNLDSLLANWLADPFPFLRQVLINQLGYGQTFLSALESALTTGNLSDLSPILTIPQDIAQNISNVFQTLTDISIVPDFHPSFPPLELGLMLHLGLPVALLVDALGAPYETFIAAQNSVTTFVDAVGSGNVLGALGALFDAPANIANGFLNGDVGLSLSTAEEPLASLIPPLELPPPLTSVPANTPIELAANIPLGGILTPLQNITASAMVPAFCTNILSFACGSLLNPVLPGFSIPNITVAGTPIGGIVPALVNFLPQQLAAAITPATSADLVNGPLQTLLNGSDVAGLLNPGDLVNGPLQTLLNGAGLEGLLNPADLGALFDSGSLTSLLDGGLAPALTGLFDPGALTSLLDGGGLTSALTGLFDPGAISGITSTLAADLPSILAGLLF